MKMRPFFSFYGAKYRQAMRLPAPRYPLIVEPFAGSLGYSIRHGQDRQVIGVELDVTIAGVWQWLLTATPAAVRALPLLEPDDDLRNMTHLHPAARDLIGFWVNRGAAAPRHRPSKWMRDYASEKPETFWGAPVRDRIADQLAHITQWSVAAGDYTTAPDVEATWIIDPPYVDAGRHYRHSSAAIDYTALGEWCRSRRGQVIVCEHLGADWLPFEPVPYNVKAARGDGSHYSAEAIWTNTPSTAEEGRLF